jgi:ABC-type transporter Mla subunit MlaD
MPTETAVLENALMIMAVCMVIQTLMFVGVAIGGFIAYRRTAEALTEARIAAEAQVAELRGRFEHVSATVDEAAQALIRGTTAVDEVMTDVRDALGSVKSGVGTVASVVSGPRTALALGLWKGLQSWRKHRDAQRIEATVTSEL